jgi:predicted RNA binding protein YcfA (HicA-like mRNA interferase family)
VARLPAISGRELVRALEKADFQVDRQRGSHIVMRQGSPPHRRVTVPDHKTIAKGTLRAVLRQAGITSQRLLELLG